MSLGDRSETTYGGMVYMRNGNGIVVYLTVSDPALMAAFKSAAQGQPLAFAPSSHTWADQLRLTQQLVQDAAALSTQGVNLLGWGPDAVGGRVHVTIFKDRKSTSDALVAQQQTRAQHVFDARYGCGATSVRVGGDDEIPIAS